MRDHLWACLLPFENTQCLRLNAMATVVIPLSRGSESLIIPASEVSEDIIRILIYERAPLESWLDAARILLVQGRENTFEKLLRTLIDEIPRWRGQSDARFARVQAMCALADFYLQQALLSEDPEAKREHCSAATRLCFEAQRVDHTEMLPHLGLGHAAVIIGDTSTARKEFEDASRLRCNGRPNIAGVLALAQLLFSQGDAAGALELYRSALTGFPECPAEVRLGIAACLVHLGDVDKADAAYRRTLDLDPSCTQALLSLAVLNLTTGADAETKLRGSRLLAKAFQADPHNPSTLVLLAHFSLQQGHATLTRRLAQAALDRINTDEIRLRAEALCLLGRAHQAEGAPDDAITCYQQALALNPSNPIAKLALAQTLMFKGNMSGAVSNLEAALEVQPGWDDALRLLTPLCARIPNTDGLAARVANHYKGAAGRNSDNPSLWEMLGDVLAGFDPSGALSAYNSAITLRRKAAETASASSSGVSLPARLLNNAAVLQLRAGNVSAASALVAESLASAAAGGLADVGAQAQVTLGYNAARVREASGDLRAAEAEYKAILAQFPAYADCHLRLASISKSRGDIAGAEEWAKKAMEASGRSADALSLLAGLHLDRRDIEAAKQCLNEINRSHPSVANEPYTRVALGNVHLYSIPGDVHHPEARESAENLLAHARENYRRALVADPSNIYAANGLGCVFAESGRLIEAKEVFLQVQEASAATDGFMRVPDIWVNLANVCSGLRQHSTAEQTYINAMKRFPEARDARVQLYLARAQYEEGPSRWDAALRTLRKTLHTVPSDARLRFNIAYLLQSLGEIVVVKKDSEWHSDELRASELTTALSSFKQARGMFAGLQKAGVEATGIDPEIISKHVDYIATRLRALAPREANAKHLAAAAAARREEKRLKLELEALQRRTEERRKQAEQEALDRARDEMARGAAAKLELLKEEWKHSATLAKAAAKGDSSAVPKAQNSKSAAKSKEDVALDALFGEDEDEDDEYVPGKDDSDGERAPEEEEEQVEAPVALAAMGLISSDEDDEEFDFAAEGAGSEDDEGAAVEEEDQRNGGRLKKRGRPTEDGNESFLLDDQGGEPAKRARPEEFEDEDGGDQGGRRGKLVLDDSD